MKMTDLVGETGILTGLQVSDKAGLLRALAHEAALLVPIDERQLLAALTAREALGSTGMGEGIAIPHARLAGVDRPFGLYAHLKTPVDYEAIDGRPVDLVFLLLLPADPRGEQLQALACVSRCLRNPQTAAALRGTGEAGASLQVLRGG